MLKQDNRRDMLNGGSTDQVGGGRAASLMRERKTRDVKVQLMEN